MDIKVLLLNIMAQPAFLIGVATLCTWLLTRLFIKFPKLAKYEGLMVTAVRLGEKAIDDDSPNAGLRRLDEALKIFDNQYKSVYNAAPPKWLIELVHANLPVVHKQLEAEGALK